MNHICELCKLKPAVVQLSHGGTNKTIHLCADCVAERGIQVCEVCRQQQATVHVTTIENNVKRVIHLCEMCGQAKGITMQGGGMPTMLHEMVTGMANAAGMPTILAETHSNLRCEVCGISWNEFRDIGRLGCANDYRVFREQLTPLIAEYHARYTRHVGKGTPEGSARSDCQGEILRCQKLLEAAIASENYESAAGLRDRLQELTPPDEDSNPTKDLQ